MNNSLHVDLDAFAESAPSFDDLKTITNQLACTCIANHRLQQMKTAKPAGCDEQYKNSLLLNKYFLLYEELSYAMNMGDIGRTETCIIAWILIFKATSKHKYAMQMTNFLCYTHFACPEGLR